MEVILFTIILYNSENSIRDVSTFYLPLFCHTSVVKYTSFLLQKWTRNEAWLPFLYSFVWATEGGFLQTIYNNYVVASSGSQ